MTYGYVSQCVIGIQEVLDGLPELTARLDAEHKHMADVIEACKLTVSKYNEGEYGQEKTMRILNRVLFNNPPKERRHD